MLASCDIEFVVMAFVTLLVDKVMACVDCSLTHM
jgi:hypothetical protein